MKTMGRLACTAAILWLLPLGLPTGAALGQEREATLRYLTDKLSQQGVVNFAGYVHDNANGKNWIVRQSAEATNVRIDPTSCKLSYHWKITSNGNTSDDRDLWMLLSRVEGIELLSMERVWKEIDSKAGNTTWSYKADPPVLILRLDRVDGEHNDFDFYNEILANRVAQTAARAVEQCGGSKVAVVGRGAAPAIETGQPPDVSRQESARVAPERLPPPAASTGKQTSAAWTPAKRLALVIGNSSYGRPGDTASEITWPDLAGGPLRDADAVAARLRQLGFEVALVKDQDLDQMSASLRRFAQAIQAAPDSLALLYYAGHGTRAPRAVGEDGEDNYLIPVHTNLASDVDAYSKALSLTQVRNVLHRSRAGVVILDACRNNALRRPSSRGAGTRGFAAAENVTGMLLAYSTPAGEVAENRPGQTSLYTELLVKELGQPGESITTTFRSVRKQLQARQAGTRLPELTDELNDDIVLVPQ
jgi:hypothetical protein